MSDRPRVSLCIPAYQAQAHLEQTLRAALAQTYDDLEVVVLDNASTDRTPEILARVDDPRLRVERNETVLPIADNWNRVVELARGELVKLVCADDLVHPDIVARQVRHVDDDPRLAVVSCRRHIISEDSLLVAHDRGLAGLTGTRTGRETVRRVIRNGGNPIGEPGCVLFHRAHFLEEGGFDGGLLYPMDIELWLRLLRHGDFHGMPETMAAFRAGNSSISAHLTPDQYAEQRVLNARLVSDPFWHVDRASRILGRVGGINARARHRVLFVVSGLAARRPRSWARHGADLDWIS